MKFRLCRGKKRRLACACRARKKVSTRESHASIKILRQAIVPAGGRFMKSRMLILVIVLASFACGTGMSARVEDFRLTDIRPNIVNPASAGFTINYNLLVNSPIESRVPVPIDHFDVGIFVEGQRAADSKLPAGTRAITLGKPIALSSPIMLGRVAGLSAELPRLVLKDDWDIAIKGTVGLQSLRLPVDFTKSIGNPVRQGGSLIPSL
jgi:hypothetical protein